MKTAVFSMHKFEKPYFDEIAGRYHHELSFFDASLSEQTAPLAKGSTAVCAFVSDKLDAQTLAILKEQGVKLIALRSAGFNHVDLEAAAALGLKVVRVPEYSPYAVAEHGVCLLLALNRKIHKSIHRVRELNFNLDGLVGFDLHGKTVGVIGTGKIGSVFARIMSGFGCRVLAYDLKPNVELTAKYGVQYTSLKEIYKSADVLSLHIPLTRDTRHMIDAMALSAMKPGALLINTGRGALIDTSALVAALKKGSLGGAALDVYEEEEGVFFHDLSDQVLQDDVLARLLTFPNVIVTAHQAFLTAEALTSIVDTTLKNITAFEKGEPLVNEVHAESHLGR